MLELKKETQALLKACKDKNSPKVELNFIFKDSENYVATNTTVLVKVKHNSSLVDGKRLLIADDAAIKKANIDPAELKMDMGSTVVSERIVGKYPPYERIIPRDTMMLRSEDLDNMLDLLYFIQRKHGFVIHHKQTPVLKALEKIPLCKDATYHYTNYNMPVSIKNGDITFVLMPYIPCAVEK